MVVREVLERFVKESPVSVMMRATLENVLSADAVDDIFLRHAVQQRGGELLFSTVVELMALVVCGVRPSVHAAYQSHCHDLGIAVKSIYNKLNGVETQVSRQLVRETAEAMAAIIEQMQVNFPALLEGYRCKIVDGNHLAATEHRLKELRRVGGGPLPGQALVVLDADRRLVCDVLPCEDAHAQERSLILELLESVQEGDAWIADRNFCTTLFLWELSVREAFFLIRQHATNVRWESRGSRNRVGQTESGEVFDEQVLLHDGFGNSLPARRITIVLDKPTEDGDRELHLLTNLPATIAATNLATAYRGRWRIEAAFGELDAVLEGEINTLGYPQAALFAFSLALVAYNLLRVVRAALSAVQGAETVEAKVSSYFLGQEIKAAWRGLAIAIPATYWATEYGGRTASQMAGRLVTLARRVNLAQFKKHTRGPKKKPPRRSNAKRQPHVSTARILQKRTPRR